MSTFHGLEMAKQALFAQQSALYTTGHNIANANTDGYSRQRVNFETTAAFPVPGRNRPDYPGQLGTGVSVGSIQRVRDEFLDKQFRSENGRSGYWDTRADALSRMEDLLNEPSDSGLSKTINQFWESLEDLSVDPRNSGARSVVTERALAVTETFQYLTKSLESIRTDLKGQIDVSTKDVNSLLNQINEINEQVKHIEPHGHLSNDLYDKRDSLIDELSNIVNIKVTYTDSGGDSLDIAQGIATVELVDNTGHSLDPQVVLIDGKNGSFNEIEISYEEDYPEAVSSFSVAGVEYDIDNLLSSNGSLKGLIESYGYDSGGDPKYVGDYPEVLEQLNEMAESLAEKFNEVHQEGYDLNGEKNGLDFFEITGDDPRGAAFNITVNEEILKDSDLIAASTEDSATGNGENALELARVLEDPSIREFFQSLVGSIAVEAQEANRMSSNTNILKSQVEERRQSVSAVSIDEEMTNMIKFQHAYNAAARAMTSMDEMLERIINNMGLVGR